jgi:hypothetical protein
MPALEEVLGAVRCTWKGKMLRLFGIKTLALELLYLTGMICLNPGTIKHG